MQIFSLNYLLSNLLNNIAISRCIPPDDPPYDCSTLKRPTLIHKLKGLYPVKVWLIILITN